jgi:hypothetical protein
MNSTYDYWKNGVPWEGKLNEDLCLLAFTGQTDFCCIHAMSGFASRTWEILCEVMHS